LTIYKAIASGSRSFQSGGVEETTEITEITEKNRVWLGALGVLGG
jgi:hypothetical protein